MLRRRLIAVLGSLIALLLVTAVGAIWALEGTLEEARHQEAQASAISERCSTLAVALSEAEVVLSASLPDEADADICGAGTTATGQSSQGVGALRPLLSDMRESIDALAASDVVRRPENAAALEGIRRGIKTFTEHAGAALAPFSAEASAIDPAYAPALARQYRDRAVAAARAVLRDLPVLSRAVRQHAEAEQRGLVNRFRGVVLGVAVLFLVVINASVLALLRTAGMVLRPVERLAEAARQLGRSPEGEPLDALACQVEVDRRDERDEFGELARAYNHLAGRVQANDRRQLETIGQVALTLNHELNNATAVIELQLQLLSRRAGGEAVEKYARRIRESLARMGQTVESLKGVRRIVSTDYVAGVRMLDLERSAADPGPDGRKDLRNAGRLPADPDESDEHAEHVN